MEDLDNFSNRQVPLELQQLDGEIERDLHRFPTLRKVGRIMGNVTLKALQDAGRVYAPGVTPYLNHPDSE